MRSQEEESEKQSFRIQKIQSAKQKNTPKNKPRKNYVSNTLSIFAIVISFISAAFTWFEYRDHVTQETIRATYEGGWMDIDKEGIDHWDVSHVYAPFHNYNLVRNNIHNSLMPIDLKKKSEYLTKERMFAELIFDHFDMLCYLHKEATSNLNFNDNQKVFIEEMLDYATEIELRNPRLLYLWDSVKGGGLSRLYQKHTIEYYHQYVLHNEKLPLDTVKFPLDSIGPYYIDAPTKLPKRKMK